VYDGVRLNVYKKKLNHVTSDDYIVCWRSS